MPVIAMPKASKGMVERAVMNTSPYARNCISALGSAETDSMRESATCRHTANVAFFGPIKVIRTSSTRSGFRVQGFVFRFRVTGH